MAKPRRTRERERNAADAASGGAVPSAPPLRPLYRRELFADGSLRAVRIVRREERERGQAMADFFGADPALSLRAHVSSMDSLLAEVVERLNLQQADFAPEILAAAWEKAVGSFLATQAELQSVAGQTARVSTAHPAVLYELRRLKAPIIRALNEALGEGSVKKLTIVHG